DRESVGTVIENTAAERTADWFRDERPSVPMRNISPDPQGHSACRARHESGGEMNTRRDFMKTGGALVVGFTLRDALCAQARAAPAAPAARPLDLKQLDTWLAIHA